MKTIWDKYHYDRQIIDEFLSAFELKVQEVDEPINWKNTLSKILVWDGFNMDLKYDYSGLIQQRKSSFVKPFIKSLISLFRPKPNSADLLFPKALLQCKILFFLKNRGEAEILLPLLKALTNKTDFAIVYEHDDTKEVYEPFQFIQFNTLVFCHQKINFRWKKIPNNKSFFVFNSWLNEQVNIEKYLTFFIQLKKKNKFLNKIIFVAGENKYVANLCYQVFKNTSVKTENLMNGAKYGWPNDADVDFNTWYVWNDKMKQFLHENAKVPTEILKVVGHPLEDQIKNHQYSGVSERLTQFRAQYKSVVTLFSTSLRFEKKFSIYKLIIDFVKRNPNFGLIIKAHQSDKEVGFFDAYKNDDQIIYFEGFSKNLLLDIIDSSSVTLSFGSTVSFESVWMGVANISYEEEPESLLPIEHPLFYHLSQVSLVEPLIMQLLTQQNPRQQDKTENAVLKQYAECIGD